MYLHCYFGELGMIINRLLDEKRFLLLKSHNPVSVFTEKKLYDVYLVFILYSNSFTSLLIFNRAFERNRPIGNMKYDVTFKK